MSNVSYTYDIANRMIEVDGVTYIWDTNGYLLSYRFNGYTSVCGFYQLTSLDRVSISFSEDICRT